VAKESVGGADSGFLVRNPDVDVECVDDLKPG
jgi:hypothetical protein